MTATAYSTLVDQAAKQGHSGPRVVGGAVSSGFRLVMSREVPKMAVDHLRVADAVLADHGVSVADISAWVHHRGGPEVSDSMADALGVSPKALQTRRSR